MTDALTFLSSSHQGPCIPLALQKLHLTVTRTGYEAIDAQAGGGRPALVVGAVDAAAVLIVRHIIEGHLLSIHWLRSAACLKVLPMRAAYSASRQDMCGIDLIIIDARCFLSLKTRAMRHQFDHHCWRSHPKSLI